MSSSAVPASLPQPSPNTPSGALGLRVSVVIPARDEAATLRAIVERVIATGCIHEVMVIDDGSIDQTSLIAHDFARKHPGVVYVHRHARSLGKGAAMHTGLRHATGDLILVQDADLEYDPGDYPALLAPFSRPEVAAVYGSRNLRRNPRSSATFYWGGRFLSVLTNLLYGSRISDESCGYKVVRADVMRELGLSAAGFEFCPELTGKLLRRGITIHEVPVSYRPRTHEEGKKIRFRDGLQAAWVLIRERCAPRTR
jgi:glycosyltransferase involved in cell wall biosynthesis